MGGVSLDLTTAASTLVILYSVLMPLWLAVSDRRDAKREPR